MWTLAGSYPKASNLHQYDATNLRYQRLQSI
jgi:hypothetical protein